MKYPFTAQHDEKDCGASCLSMICEFYGAKLTISHICDLIEVDNNGSNIYGIVKGAELLNLKTDALSGSYEELCTSIEKKEIVFPFIARIITKQIYEHFIVVYKKSKNGFIIGDPGKSKISKITEEDFKNNWLGQIVMFSPESNFKKINERKGGFKKYFKFIIAQKKLLYAIFILSTLIIGINLGSSVVFQYVINDIVEYEEESAHFSSCEEGSHEHKQEETVVFYTVHKYFPKVEIIFKNIDSVCITILLLYIFKSSIQMLRGYLLALVSKKIDIPLTMNYYKHLIKLPFSFFGKRKTGELMSRFSDIQKIRSTISSVTLTVMVDTLTAIGCGIVLFLINSHLFTITLLILLIYSIVIFIFKNPIKSVNYDLMDSYATITSYLKETIVGIETVKSYQFEDECIDKTNSIYEGYANGCMKSSVLYSNLNSIINLIHSIGIIVILWYGTHLCQKGIISFADLLVFYYLADMFIKPVENLINLQPQIQTAVVAAERMNDVTDSPTEQVSIIDNVKKYSFDNVEFKNVSFRYGNRPPVLTNINIKVKKGEKIAIVGESGCGKTTIAKLLLSFYSANHGNITINGEDISNIPKSVIRNNIAYVSQDTFMFSDSIVNNILIGNKKAENENVKRICSKCCIENFTDKMPFGYYTALEENGKNISVGQKQRVAIARALLKNPDILIMDEATSNLDSITEIEIRNTIDSLCKDKACIIIAHRMETIKNCDYIYVMENGNIVESGTPTELMQINKKYSKYVFAS